MSTARSPQRPTSLFTHTGGLLVLLVACALAGGAETVGMATGYSVATRGLRVEFDGQGHSTGASIGGRPVPMTGESSLGGCTTVGEVTARKLAGGGCEFVRRVENARKRTAVVKDRFTPTKDSIRWETEVVSEGELWTTPVRTHLVFGNPSTLRFWMPSTGAELPDGQWADPFELLPFAGAQFPYGGGSHCFSVPLASILAPASDLGLSVVLSPEEPMLGLRLETGVTATEAGLAFVRSDHRLGAGKRVRFSQDLVAHPADWRGGLGWMVKRYPAFFDPPNPRVDAMAGCGAYSASEEVPDVRKMKGMAFRINWRARFDWPYLGLSLPPVKDGDEPWRCSDVDTSGNPIPGRETFMTFHRLNDYGRRMRQAGFQVLNYFTTTEFGLAMKGPDAVRSDLAEEDLWKDCTSFAYRKLRDGILLNEAGSPLGTWGGAVAMDCGGPHYRAFVLEQARRHVQRLPDVSGVCIDRLDWLSRVNPSGDDGVGLYGGKPGRLVLLAWLNLMAEMGPVFHQAGQVIFANPVTAYRLEVARHLDGIYDEFGMNGPNLNASAFLCVRKPLLAWTPGGAVRVQNTPEADPDGFFQRHLLMGAYPTAPYPGNDHTITPAPDVDRYYLDYGPLLDSMRGKKWVLTPHCLEAATPGVKANLFQVPGGYVLPVTFGKGVESASVRIQNLKGLARAKCEVLHPGAAGAAPIPATYKKGVLELQVPLKRGCAMVKVTPR